MNPSTEDISHDYYLSEFRVVKGSSYTVANKKGKILVEFMVERVVIFFNGHSDAVWVNLSFIALEWRNLLFISNNQH